MSTEFPSLASLTRQAEDLLVNRKPLPADPEALAGRRAWLRRHLIEALGFMPPRDAPLVAFKEAQETLAQDLIKETVTFSLNAGTTLRANVCRPTDETGRHPGVILLHGWDLDKSGLNRAAAGFARAGYVVLLPEHQCVRGHAEDCTKCADSIPGMTYMGLTIYENMRSLDYLSSREDVDSDRIACMGVCWSGMQSYVLSALDERIKAVCAVCGIAAQGTLPTDFAFMQGHLCLGEFLPGFLSAAAVQDLMALIAPRPLLVQNNVTDSWYPVLSFRAARAEAKMVYRTLGYPERFDTHVETSERDLTPVFTERAIKWLDTHL